VEGQRELHADIEDEIRHLLEQGQSWTVVADAIGITRQGARQRYGHLAPRKPGSGDQQERQRVSGSAEPDAQSSRARKPQDAPHPQDHETGVRPVEGGR
jgi:hypothetical protein